MTKKHQVEIVAGKETNSDAQTTTIFVADTAHPFSWESQTVVNHDPAGDLFGPIDSNEDWEKMKLELSFDK